MIVAIARGDKQDVVLLGLSRGNIERLQANQPIMKDLKPYGVELSVAIMFGETEAKLAEMLAKEGLIGEETEIHEDPNLR